jgi:hypothetical protein
MSILDDIKSRCEEVGECWEWRGAFTGPKGRNTPCMKLPAALDQKRPTVSVHRFVFELENEVRPGNLVWRSCCNRACVNPEHQKQGTRKQFANFMKRNGSYKPSALRIARTTAKRRSQATKLTMEKAREVRLAQGQRSAKELAAELGINPSWVWRIWRGEGWKEEANSVFGIRA